MTCTCPNRDPRGFGPDPECPEDGDVDVAEAPDALSVAHPFELDTRVRHDGIRWSLKPFAAVLEVRPQHDRTFEYRVLIDTGHDFGHPDRPRETWWASYHTWGVAP